MRLRKKEIKILAYNNAKYKLHDPFLYDNVLGNIS